MTLPTARRPHVLVVDDERNNLIVAHAGLSPLYDVEAISDPIEAVERALEADLLVTDQRMPGMSGLDLVRRVARLRPDLPVIVITAYEDAASVALATNEHLPIRRWLAKPYDMLQLAADIADVLNQELPEKRAGLDSPAKVEYDALMEQARAAREAARERLAELRRKP